MEDYFNQIVYLEGDIEMSILKICKDFDWEVWRTSKMKNN